MCNFCNLATNTEHHEHSAMAQEQERNMSSESEGTLVASSPTPEHQSRIDVQEENRKLVEENLTLGMGIRHLEAQNDAYRVRIGNLEHNNQRLRLARTFHKDTRESVAQSQNGSDSDSYSDSDSDESASSTSQQSSVGTSKEEMRIRDLEAENDKYRAKIGRLERFIDGFQVHIDRLRLAMPFLRDTRQSVAQPEGDSGSNSNESATSTSQQSSVGKSKEEMRIRDLEAVNDKYRVRIGKLEQNSLRLARTQQDREDNLWHNLKPTIAKLLLQSQNDSDSDSDESETSTSQQSSVGESNERLPPQPFPDQTLTLPFNLGQRHFSELLDSYPGISLYTGCTDISIEVDQCSVVGTITFNGPVREISDAYIMFCDLLPEYHQVRDEEEASEGDRDGEMYDGESEDLYDEQESSPARAHTSSASPAELDDARQSQIPESERAVPYNNNESDRSKDTRSASRDRYGPLYRQERPAKIHTMRSIIQAEKDRILAGENSPSPQAHDARMVDQEREEGEISDDEDGSYSPKSPVIDHDREEGEISDDEDGSYAPRSPNVPSGDKDEDVYDENASTYAPQSPYFPVARPESSLPREGSYEPGRNDKSDSYSPKSPDSVSGLFGNSGLFSNGNEIRDEGELNASRPLPAHYSFTSRPPSSPLDQVIDQPAPRKPVHSLLNHQYGRSSQPSPFGLVQASSEFGQPWDAPYYDGNRGYNNKSVELNDKSNSQFYGPDIRRSIEQVPTSPQILIDPEFTIDGDGIGEHTRGHVGRLLPGFEEWSVDGRMYHREKETPEIPSQGDTNGVETLRDLLGGFTGGVSGGNSMSINHVIDNTAPAAITNKKRKSPEGYSDDIDGPYARQSNHFGGLRREPKRPRFEKKYTNAFEDRFEEPRTPVNSPATSSPSPPKDKFPLACREYVARAYLPQLAIPGIKREDMEAKLRETIRISRVEGRLWSDDWDSMDLPQVMLQKKLAKLEQRRKAI